MHNLHNHIRTLKKEPFFLLDGLYTTIKGQFPTRWKRVYLKFNYVQALLNPFLLENVVFQDNSGAKAALVCVLEHLVHFNLYIQALLDY